ncbi:MAG: hypothetical protein ACK449_00260 [Planctomycetota bacterium]|jgi:hypothetical protein
MVKRNMGQPIYREPMAEQAARYREIRELISEEISDIKHQAKAMRENRRVGIQHAVAMLKSEREHQGMSLADISRETGFSKYAEALRMDLSVSLRLKR